MLPLLPELLLPLVLLMVLMLPELLLLRTNATVVSSANMTTADTSATAATVGECC